MTEAAAVHRDDELRSHLLDFINRPHRHAIAFHKPVRNKRPHILKAKAGKGIKQEGRCAQTINIIIAIHHNSLALGVSLHETLNSVMHARQQKRVVLVGVIVRMQKGLAGSVRRQATAA